MQRMLIFDEPLASASETEDFELVVGRRQAAALTFLALVVVALCSGASYLAGKAIAPREEAPVPMIKLEQPPAPLIEATIVPQAVPLADPSIPLADAPLFASPVAQAIYIQVGAVDKGVATVLAEGLRKHALDSFVAPGPSAKSFRVLIGPFADAEGYQKARNIVAEIGLDSFARRYQSQ